jgi:serine/threonine protein kinase
MPYSFVGASEENGAKKIEKQLEEIQDKNSDDFKNVSIKAVNLKGQPVNQTSLPKQFLIDNQLNVADFKLLGSGGYGSVYSVKRLDGTRAIVKISSLTAKENNIKKLVASKRANLFANEIIMESEVYNKFPSFLPKPQESMIYSTGQNEEKEVFGVQIQERVNGTSVLNFLAKMDVPSSEKLQVISQVLSFMETVNSQGIEHGDCHFSNIMYDRDNKTISAID